MSYRAVAGRDKGKLFYRRFFVVGIWLYGVFIVGLDCGFVAAVKAGIGISAVVGNRKCNDRSYRCDTKDNSKIECVAFHKSAEAFGCN